MKRIALLAIAAAAAPVAAAQVRPEADIRQVLADRLKGFEQRVSIAVGIIGPEGRRVVVHGSMGTADPRPATGDTLYEIGSITKVFTSLLLADMVERGEVALDDPVAKYLPAGITVPERGGKRITLVDLSTHRSALPRMPSDFAPKQPTNPYPDYPIERLYEFLSGYQLPREIGAEYEYSNLATGLLGHALARRAGMSYEQLLRERVFRPLGMTSTAIALTPELRSRMSVPHTSVFRLAPTPDWTFTDAFAGAGAIRSTVNDMLAFLAAQMGYTRTPLSAAMARMLSVRRDATPDFKVGLAIRVEQRGGTEIVWHGGATYGSRCFSGYDPKSRTGVVVLSNYNSGSGIDDIGRFVLDRNAQIDTGSAVKPRDRAVGHVPPALLNAYAGRYQFATGEIWTVRRDGTRFFVTRPSGPDVEIFPEGDFEKGADDFFSKSADAMYTFDFSPASASLAAQLTFKWAFVDARVARRIE